MLRARGLLSEAGAARARALEAETGERAERIAAKLGLVADRDLALAYAEALGVPVVDGGEYPAAPVPAGRLAPEFLRAARAVPVAATAETVTLAMADPLDAETAAAVGFAARRQVRARPGLPAEIDAALARLFGADAAMRQDAAAGATAETDLERLRDLASEAPVIRMVNALITEAVERGASDIHLEPMEDRLRARLRIDGVLREIDAPPAALRQAVISRVKIMANLDIAERRLAQDGRIRMAVRGQEIDLRVATTPAIHGESVVLRILDRAAVRLDFAALGFDADLLAEFRDSLRRPHGIVLVTGPTGSGKTTTLYTALSELNTPERKLLSVEDPVEYQLAGITQVQVKPEIGLGFATVLRGFLRQDPDIMMVGEIRDAETAQIAVQAALTGHLVLSTVHTNDAPGAVTRLLDMGVEDYLLTSTLNAALAQRLVRKLCPACRRPRAVPAELAARLGVPAGSVFHEPVGCASCNGTGYAGRTMIVELMSMTDTLRALVLRRAPTGEIRAAARAGGMRGMFARGLDKVLAGITSLDEVLRATRDA